MLSRRNSSSSSTSGSTSTSRRGSTLDVAAVLACSSQHHGARRGSRSGPETESDESDDRLLPLTSSLSLPITNNLGGGRTENPLEFPLGQELADQLRACPRLPGSGGREDVERRPSDDLMGNYLRAFGALASGASEEDLPGDVVVTELSQTLTTGAPVRVAPPLSCSQDDLVDVKHGTQRTQPHRNQLRLPSNPTEAARIECTCSSLFAS